MRGGRSCRPDPTPEGAIREDFLQQLRRLDEELTAEADSTPTISADHGLYHATSASRMGDITAEGLDVYADAIELERVNREPSKEHIRTNRVRHLTEEILERTRLSRETPPPMSRREAVSFWPDIETTIDYITGDTLTETFACVLRIEPARFSNESLYVGDFGAVLTLQEQVADFADDTDFDALAHLIESMGIPPELQNTAEGYWRDLTETETADQLAAAVKETRYGIPEVLVPRPVPWSWATAGVSERGDAE